MFALHSYFNYRHYRTTITDLTLANLAATSVGSRFKPVMGPTSNTATAPTSGIPFPTVYGCEGGRLNIADNRINFDKYFFSPTALGGLFAVV